MSKRPSFPTGAPCWVELFTSDPDLTVPFYCGLFGWTPEFLGEQYGGYINLHRDGEMVAGCMRNDGTTGAPDAWSVYLTSDDAEGTVKAAADRGGHVIVPAMGVMDLGTMAVLADPGGAAIGVWQPGSHAGFGVVDEPGSPAWFELLTVDHAAAVRFYEDVFGWDTHVLSDTDEFRYTTLGEGQEAKAGIMDASGFLPVGATAGWRVYFAVDDADAAVGVATNTGGAVVRAPQDTPYGRLAELADPTGAKFAVMASG
jgi:predicted enzyme related to lactoylglutathione lyase